MGMFTEEPLFDDPSLPVGWHRKVVQRKTGATAGAWDVYVYNPDGKKFRSRNELRTFFIQTGSKMNSEDFDFSVKGKGHHNKDGLPDGLQMTKQPEMSTSEQGEQKTITNDFTNNDSNSSSGRRKVTAVKRKLGEVKVPATPPSFTTIKSKAAVAKKPPPKITKPRPIPRPVISKTDSSDSSSPKASVTTVTTTSKYFSPPSKILPLKVDPRVKWSPPKSPYSFIQEQLFRDPWQLLVATIFLNKTNGKVACPLVWQFLKSWPTAEAARKADWMDIAELMTPLGLHHIRAQRIVRMSDEYLKKDWQNPSELYGISKYGQDSYRLFCLGEWKSVKPTDIMLKLYQDWILTNSKVLKLE